MVILLGKLDLSHVKTTNPANFVVSGEKKTFTFTVGTTSTMYMYELIYEMEVGDRKINIYGFD